MSLNTAPRSDVPDGAQPVKPARWRPEHILDPYTSLDPHPFYSWLRDTGSVQWNEPTGAWYVTSHAHVSELLLEPRLGARSKEAQLARLDPTGHAEVFAVEDFLARWLVFSDPPFQTRVRRIVAPRLTPRVIGALDEVVLSAARHHVRGLGAGTHDLLAEAIRPFALDVVCRVLGIEDADRESVLAWSDALVHYLSRPGIETAAARAAADAAAQLTDYVATRALASPAGPIAEALAEPVRCGELTAADAAAVFAQILTGGIEPVAVAAATGISRLVGDAEQHRAVRSGNVSHGRAVEEILRFCAPFHYAPRTAAHNLSAAGRRIERGQRVVLVLAAANRDPAVFPDPDRFDVRRAEADRHLSFGRGGHYCLGSVLARREIEVLVREVLAAGIAPGTPLLLPSLGMTAVAELPCLI